MSVIAGVLLFVISVGVWGVYLEARLIRRRLEATPAQPQLGPTIMAAPPVALAHLGAGLSTHCGHTTHGRIWTHRQTGLTACSECATEEHI